MKLARTFCFLLAMAAAFFAVAASDQQQTEYGRKTEMKGTKVVFVDTGTNIEFRENVATLLERELPEVSVSDRFNATVDLILQFAIDSNGDRKGSATLLVLARPTTPNSIRILAKYEDSKSSIWTSKLSAVLVRRFLRDYLAANPRQPKTSS
jgi:hypothetical protein